MDGRDVALGAEQGAVAAHERLAAELEPLVEQLPELVLIPLGDDADLREVDGDDALVEAALELIVALFVLPRGEERAAPHGAEDVALVDLAHLFGGDVVGVQPLGGTLDGELGDVVVLAALEAVDLVEHVHELGEGGGDVHALFVFDALVALAQDLGDDHRVLFEVLVVFVEVEEEGDEGGLPVGRHQGIDLVLDGLHAAFQLVFDAVGDKLVYLFVGELRAGLAEVLFELVAALAQVLPRWRISTDCPPYCEQATAAMICVTTVQAT